MKKRVTNIAAMLLVVWYSLCVIGFDVHTCRGSGRTFIATVISGINCEDIHSDHNVISCTCCRNEGSGANSDRESFNSMPCCTDDWQIINLTGTRVLDHRNLDYSLYGISPMFSNVICEVPFIYSWRSKAFYNSFLKDYRFRDINEYYSTWRI